MMTYLKKKINKSQPLVIKNRNVNIYQKIDHLSQTLVFENKNVDDLFE